MEAFSLPEFSTIKTPPRSLLMACPLQFRLNLLNAGQG